MTVNRTPWIFPHPDIEQPECRLFCFPYAGGGASVFRQWQQHMPPGVQVCAVQLPGRESRMAEVPCTDLESLVEQLYDALASLLETPFALFGHSLGAKIAFALAICAQKRQRPVRHLFVAGSRAPHLQEPRPLHHLPDAELIAALRRYAATPEALLANRELMSLYMPLLRADFTLDETYVYRDDEPLLCPLTVFGGEDDPETGSEDLDAWQQHCKSTFCCHMFPGGHFFIRSAQKQLLSRLIRELAGSV